jgi:hypothetical protein
MTTEHSARPCGTLARTSPMPFKLHPRGRVVPAVRRPLHEQLELHPHLRCSSRRNGSVGDGYAVVRPKPSLSSTDGRVRKGGLPPLVDVSRTQLGRRRRSEKKNWCRDALRHVLLTACSNAREALPRERTRWLAR